MQKDKKLHIIVGFAIALVVIFMTCELIGYWSYWAALFVSIAAGFGKEEYDKKFGGTYDRWDIVATFAGGCIGSASLFIGTLIFH